ncbi:MAG: bifunctional nuclease family protein [Chloroflexi bacterium]|nr:bifunctional nuclease family protein [Chloroflexota bacterium]MBU1749360.1 bifunctional nuclease family protein [Chloroflexota bacterium]MBU1877441.1 bifunctional nuclease family protein [Chloroflexota bacterium]
MKEMFVESIRVSPVIYHRVVVLKEKDGERYLPIWIGPQEANAIAMKLQDIETPRPLTHDLLANVFGALEAQVLRVVVSDLAEDTFYATIVGRVRDEQFEIDARPSDAMALAVRLDVPIFAAEHVLALAAVVPEDEVEPGDEPADDTLVAFRDFVDTLDLTDFGN